MNAVYLRKLPLEERTRLAVAEIEAAGLAVPQRPPEFYRRLVDAIGERLRRPKDVLVHGAFALPRRRESSSPTRWGFWPRIRRRARS